jgi:hypothetical protein
MRRRNITRRCRTRSRKMMKRLRRRMVPLKENVYNKELAGGGDKVYFILTSFISDPNDSVRKTQYTNGVNSVLSYTRDLSKYKVIIVENNGKRPTYLDNLGVDVYYTNNSKIGYQKGTTELLDTLDCIKKYNIEDDDFVVKMTGRYVLDKNSQFMEELSRLDSTTDCIIHYGSYLKSTDKNDCITGLIGMRSKYIKRIERGIEPIEHSWAKTSHEIPSSKVKVLKTLGIHICPGSNKYFLV